MNRAVLALKSLREAIGSEWRESKTRRLVRLESVDGTLGVVTISAISEAPNMAAEIPVTTFLKQFKLAPAPEAAPAWYERLLADRLV